MILPPDPKTISLAVLLPPMSPLCYDAVIHLFFDLYTVFNTAELKASGSNRMHGISEEEGTDGNHIFDY